MTHDNGLNLQHVLIKWTGSKRRQARQIVAKFPRKIATYYEPFLGGGSVLYELLASDVEVGRYEVSDICQPLIALWKLIQNDPTGLIEGYAENWRVLQVHGIVTITRFGGSSTRPRLLISSFSAPNLPERARKVQP